MKLQSLCFVMAVACIAAVSGRNLPGTDSRRDGLLVADLTPVQADPKVQSLCKNSCNMHGVCVYDAQSPFPPSCNCLPMWSGDDCSVAACPNDCSNAGVCDTKTGYCQCNEHLGKADCSVNLLKGVCPGFCNGNGVCTDGVCSCFQGWYGLDCAKFHCPNNCSFHGACVENGNWGTSSCKCEKGFQGEDCGEVAVEKKSCPILHGRICSGNGVCNSDTGTCSCTKGWTGDNCAEPSCTRGYLGAQDASTLEGGCPNDCSCHGLCQCDIHTDATGADVDVCYCLCEPGWGGEACAGEVKEDIPFKQYPNPMPDPEVYPDLNPWLTVAERANIARRQQQRGETVLLPSPYDQMLSQKESKIQ